MPIGDKVPGQGTPYYTADPDYPGSKDWVNPEARLGQYDAIIIDYVTVHLSPGLIKDGVRPDAELLNQVTDCSA